MHCLVEADVLEDLEPAHKHIEPKDPNLIIERKKYRKAFQGTKIRKFYQFLIISQGQIVVF